MLKLPISIIILSAIIFLSIYSSKKGSSIQENIQIITSACSLNHSSCSVEVLDSLVINFDLLEKDLPALEPLQVVIKGAPDVESIKIWFEGRDMNMGQHFLIPVSNEQTILNESMIFKGMIPICGIDKQMVWRLVTEILSQNTRVKIQFDLQATASVQSEIR